MKKNNKNANNHKIIPIWLTFLPLIIYFAYNCFSYNELSTKLLLDAKKYYNLLLKMKIY